MQTTLGLKMSYDDLRRFIDSAGGEISIVSSSGSVATFLSRQAGKVKCTKCGGKIFQGSSAPRGVHFAQESQGGAHILICSACEQLLSERASSNEAGNVPTSVGGPAISVTTSGVLVEQSGVTTTIKLDLSENPRRGHLNKKPPSEVVASGAGTFQRVPGTHGRGHGKRQPRHMWEVFSQRK